MRRVHLIEFHELPWFPSPLRDYVTDALQFGFNVFRVYAPVAALLQRVLDTTGSQSIVDLCSGGSGPWLDLARRLQFRTSQADPLGLQIWLTDKYPNLRAFQAAREASENQIVFYEGPVDARKVPRELKGLRTMFTSFHHFSPDDARAILQDAVDARESVGIFEATRRAWPTIGLMVAWVLVLFVCTPWVRPF